MSHNVNNNSTDTPVPPDSVFCYFCSCAVLKKDIEEHNKRCDPFYNSPTSAFSTSTINSTIKVKAPIVDEFDPFSSAIHIDKSETNPNDNNNAPSTNVPPSKNKFIIRDEESDENKPQPKPVLKQIQQQDAKPVSRDTVACPICSKRFEVKEIENHVNTCLDGGSAPKVVAQPKPEPKPVVDEKEALIVKEQEEYYNRLKQRLQQEEADRLMALKLMNELEAKEKEIAEREKQKQQQQKQQQQQQPPKPKLSDDERLALEIQKKEEEEYKKMLKEKEEKDKRLAEELWNKEKQAEEERKKKKEWEQALQLVRQQAKSEVDGELAKLLREKEELLAQMQQLSNMPKQTDVKVSLDDIDYPNYWNYQVHNYQTFDVPKNSDEWYRVVNEFKKGMPHGKIHRIERNQNKTLWMFYYLQRQVVAANNANNANERWLFHGSRNDAYDAIMNEGFDHRVANLGGAIGAGIYFATNSGTSSGYVAAGKWGTKKMLWCRVTLGSIGPGQHGLRRPPEKSKGKLYDSVGDHHTMFVVFDNHQAYPEYMIHFT